MHHHARQIPILTKTLKYSHTERSRQGCFPSCPPQRDNIHLCVRSAKSTCLTIIKSTLSTKQVKAIKQKAEPSGSSKENKKIAAIKSRKLHELPGSPVSEVQVGAYFYRSLSPLFNKSFDPKDKKKRGGELYLICNCKLKIASVLVLHELSPSLPSA